MCVTRSGSVHMVDHISSAGSADVTKLASASWIHKHSFGIHGVQQWWPMVRVGSFTTGWIRSLRAAQTISITLVAST